MNGAKPAYVMCKIAARGVHTRAPVRFTQNGAVIRAGGTTVSDETFLAVGTDVEVRCRFDGHWSPGFVVAAVVAEDERRRVSVRRRSDGAVLPALFAIWDVRPRGRVPGAA